MQIRRTLLVTVLLVLIGVCVCADEAVKPERVHNPFAPNTHIKSLDAPRQLRPDKLPNHPLSTWVADSIIRWKTEEGVAGITGEVESRITPELRRFSDKHGFYIREDGSLWISNGRVGLRFSPSGMAITSFYDLGTGTDAVSKNVKNGVPWKIVWLTNGDPSKTPEENYGNIDIFMTREETGKALAKFIDTTDVSYRDVSYKLQSAGSRLNLTIDWKGVTTPG